MTTKQELSEVNNALWGLKRNDKRGAFRVAAQFEKIGAFNAAVRQVLTMLQDDVGAMADELDRRFGKGKS